MKTEIIKNNDGDVYKRQDMNQWASDKEVASWVGVTPQNNESANKKKSVRISKAGQYIKPILVQCALAAIKCNSEPYFKIKYNRIKKRRGNKKAIIAIARMLLVSIYHMAVSYTHLSRNRKRII